MKKTIHIEGKSIRKTCLAAGALFKKWGIRPAESDDLVLALDESLTNILEHGYVDLIGKTKNLVSIEVVRGEKKVYIVISDNARHFSFESVQLPEKSDYINSNMIGGFGISIIKKIMSDVRHFQLFDENVLILGKEVTYQKITSGKTPIKIMKNASESAMLFCLI